MEETTEQTIQRMRIELITLEIDNIQSLFRLAQRCRQLERENEGLGRKVNDLRCGQAVLRSERDDARRGDEECLLLAERLSACVIARANCEANNHRSRKNPDG